MIRCPECRSTILVDRSYIVGDAGYQPGLRVRIYHCLSCGVKFEHDQSEKRAVNYIISRSRCVKVITGEKIGGF